MGEEEFLEIFSENPVAEPKYKIGDEVILISNPSICGIVQEHYVFGGRGIRKRNRYKIKLVNRNDIIAHVYEEEINLKQKYEKKHMWEH
jgi:hypothetical protein